MNDLTSQERAGAGSPDPAAPLVPLGRSDVRVSRVIFGAMALSPAQTPAQRENTIRAAIDAGITSIDTAPLYEFGLSEELVGRAIKDVRARVQVLTKVGLRWDDTHGQVLFRFHDAQGREQAVRKDSRPASVKLEVERSLKRLGVDTLDLVQVHHPDPDTPIAETMGALADLLRAGKLRAIGVSNYSAAQMREAQAALGDIPLASNQVHYSLLERWPESEILPLARKAQIGVLAYSPLEQGLLTGQPRRFAAGDGRGDSPRFHKDNVARVQRAIDASLAEIARARGVTVAQVALAWLLAQSGLTAVIAGASTVPQVQSNAFAMSLALRSDELLAISQAFAAVKLDPYAGQDLLGRARKRAERLAHRVKRKLLG